MTPAQPTFADLELQGARRRTRRAELLARLDAEVPWAGLLPPPAPLYPEGRRARPPLGAERMLRMHGERAGHSTRRPVTVRDRLRGGGQR